MGDFWIGDQVKLIATGQHGTVEAENYNGYTIKIGQQLIDASEHQIELLPEPEERDWIYEKVMRENSSSSPAEKAGEFLVRKANFQNAIDLHIEQIDTNFEKLSPHEILSKQRDKLKSFLSDAFKYQIAEITIIHGKGAGALKSEVENILMEAEFRCEWDAPKKMQSGSMLVKIQY